MGKTSWRLKLLNLKKPKKTKMATRLERVIEKYMAIYKTNHEYVPIGEVISDFRSLLPRPRE